MLVCVARDLPATTLLALGASTLMQLACAVLPGRYHPVSVTLLVAATILLVAALRWLGSTARVPATAVLAALLLLLGHAALAPVKPLYALSPVPLLSLFPMGAFGLTLTYFARMDRPYVDHLRFSVLVILAAALGAQVIAASPQPRIDVFAFQTQAADELIAGHNPYATVSVIDSNPALAENLWVPYTYPPVQLLATTLARLVGGDVRWAMLAGLLLAGVAARQTSRRNAPHAPAFVHDLPALVLFGGPIVAIVLEQSWVDLVPLGLLSAALWALAAERHWIAAVGFGLALAAKQPLALLFPLLWLLPHFGWRKAGVVAGTAAATILPFLVWDPDAFAHGTIAYFVQASPRNDALTLSNMLRFRFGWAPGELLGISAALLAVAISWSRLRRSLAAFLLLASLVLLFVFLTGKLAFTNYYFFLSGMTAMGGVLACEEAA
jgi:hypothetical protein